MKFLRSKLLAQRSRPAAQQQADTRGPDSSLTKGSDIGIGILVFAGIGYGLDRWLGWFPVMTIALLILGFAGNFVRVYYAYQHEMQRLETERDQAKAAATAAKAASEVRAA